ncbi:MAG: MerR family transcriptional regulator [Ruminiclostridium sp.]|nr:MerR family transcriptional regulator [Ruminiclostridium sp.]
MKTVTKVADIVGLTVRMIQEYEKYGVAIKPTERNKYGYLMYDDAAIDRLWQIRFYKELGYKKKEIKAIFDDPCYDFSAALEAQIKQLEQKKKKIDNLINVANLMRETGITPKALHSQATLLGVTFNDTFGVLGALTRQFSNDETELEDSPITDKDFERIFESFENVLTLYKNGLAYDADSVQTAVQTFHKLASPLLSNTVTGLMMASVLIAPGSKGAEEIEAEYKLPGAAKFIQQAVNKYVEDNIDKGPDKIFNDAFDEIVTFGKQKYKPWSDEVQTVVDRIYNFYATAYNPSFISPKELMEQSVQIYADPGYYGLFDKASRGKGAGKYVSAAFKYYCKNLDTPEQS